MLPANEGFDLSIYAYNKSLRLPNCGKVSRKTASLEMGAKLNIATRHALQDFIVSDVSSAVIVIPKNILFDKRMPVQVSRGATLTRENDIAKVEEFIRETYKEQPQVQFAVKLVKGVIKVIPSNKYKCAVCKRDHDQQSMYVVRQGDTLKLNCYSNKERNTGAQPVIIQLDSQVKDSRDETRKAALQRYYDNAVVTNYSQTSNVNMKYINFNITSNLVVVISDMGTGKSVWLKNQIDGTDTKYNSIVCLAFRKTFVAAF